MRERVGPEDRAKCFEQLGKESVSIPVARAPELAVEEVAPLPETEQLAEMVHDERISVLRAKAAERKSWVTIPRKSVIVPDAYFNQDITYRLLVVVRRIVHFLGDCYMIPGIDYFRYQYLEQLMPSISDFVGVCKLCSKKGSVRVHESSGTETLSSTSHERNWNLALAERQEAWKDRLSVVQVNQLSVLTCSIPCGFLSWCEGRACTALLGLSTTGQNFPLPNQEGVELILSLLTASGRSTERG